MNKLRKWLIMKLAGDRLVVLNATVLYKYFPIYADAKKNPIIEGNDSAHVMSMLLSGEVDAAMIPTPLVSAQMAAEGGIAVVLTTETVPSMGVSVSANISSELREKLHNGLVNADKTPEGKKMLEETILNPFEKTTNQEYFGFSELLDQL